MTYQGYFRNSDFEDIWTILSGFYMEHEDMKPLYFLAVGRPYCVLQNPEVLVDSWTLAGCK